MIQSTSYLSNLGRKPQYYGVGRTKLHQGQLKITKNSNVIANGAPNSLHFSRNSAIQDLASIICQKHTTFQEFASRNILHPRFREDESLSRLLNRILSTTVLNDLRAVVSYGSHLRKKKKANHLIEFTIAAGHQVSRVSFLNPLQSHR